MKKDFIRSNWEEVAFALSSLGSLTLPSEARDYLIALTTIPTIALIRKLWVPEIGKLQRQAFGWRENDVFGMYGTNEWTSTIDGSFFEPVNGLPPAPGFNYRGLLSVAACLNQFELFNQANLKDILEIKGNSLLVGGARVTPQITSFLSAQGNTPFQFVNETELNDEFRPNEIPKTITRHFNHNGHIYSKNSITGKYLVFKDKPEIPPLGPFIDSEGFITSDVLVLTIGRDKFGNKVVAANAGYGATDRLQDVLFNGNFLEKICTKLNKFGSNKIQAAFTLPVNHSINGEEYGTPHLVQVVNY